MHVPGRMSIRSRLGIALLAVSMTGAAAAQNYPTKPVRVVVPFGVGGSVDTLTRLTMQHVTQAWGQQMVVDVRPGAGSLIGTDIVAKSRSDGYTVMMANASSAMAVSVYKTVPYDLLKEFTALGMIGYTPHIVVVHPSLPAKTLQELVALAKSRPKAILYSSAGNGVGSHLAVEAFASAANVSFTHVPYKGAAPAVTGLVGGEVALMVVNLVSALPHVKTGKLRALALTDSKRTPLLPDLPTTAEQGLPFEFIEWYGMVAPAGTPADIVAKWNAEINRIVGLPEFQERLAAMGATPKAGTPAEFNSYLKSEVERYAKVVKAANVVVD